MRMEEGCSRCYRASDKLVVTHLPDGTLNIREKGPQFDHQAGFLQLVKISLELVKIAPGGIINVKRIYAEPNRPQASKLPMREALKL